MNSEFEKYKVKKSEAKNNTKKFIDLYKNNSEILNLVSLTSMNSNNKNILKYNKDNQTQRQILEQQSKNILPSDIPSMISRLPDSLYDQFFTLNQNSNNKNSETCLNIDKNNSNDVNNQITPKTNKNNQNTINENGLDSFILHLNIFKNDIKNLLENLNNGNVDLNLHQKIFEYFSFLFIKSDFSNLNNSNNEILSSNLISKIMNNEINKKKLIDSSQPNSNIFYFN